MIRKIIATMNDFFLNFTVIYSIQSFYILLIDKSRFDLFFVPSLITTVVLLYFFRTREFLNLKSLSGIKLKEFQKFSLAQLLTFELFALTSGVLISSLSLYYAKSQFELTFPLLILFAMMLFFLMKFFYHKLAFYMKNSFPKERLIEFRRQLSTIINYLDNCSSKKNQVKFAYYLKDLYCSLIFSSVSNLIEDAPVWDTSSLKKKLKKSKSVQPKVINDIDSYAETNKNQLRNYLEELLAEFKEA